MKRLLALLAGLVVVVVSSALLVYGWWLNEIRIADDSFYQGRYQQAQQEFLEAWSGWELRVLPQQLSEPHRVRIALNLIQIGYVLDEYQKTMDFLREATLSALTDRAEYHFWVANLMMRQAPNNAGAAFIETLGECQRHYLESVRKDPDFWDAKYNYEYVNALLARLRKNEERQEEDLKILMENMRTDEQRRKKVLPFQKRG